MAGHSSIRKGLCPPSTNDWLQQALPSQCHQVIISCFLLRERNRYWSLPMANKQYLFLGLIGPPLTIQITCLTAYKGKMINDQAVSIFVTMMRSCILRLGYALQTPQTSMYRQALAVPVVNTNFEN